MLGGRSFMVHEQLAVAAASDGSLLLAAHLINSISFSNGTAHGRPRCEANH